MKKYCWLCEGCAKLFGYEYEVEKTERPVGLSGKVQEGRSCEQCGRQKKFTEYYMIGGKIK